MTSKICNRCHKEKPINQFYRKSASKDGLQERCKDCHRVESRISEQRYRKNNPEKYADKLKKFYEQNPGKYKEYGLSERQKLRKKVLDGYGNKCACCGETEPHFLALDHVQGGGNRHRGAGKGKSMMAYRDAINRAFPNAYQLLCHNCNCAKSFYGKCPHQKD